VSKKKIKKIQTHCFSLTLAGHKKSLIRLFFVSVMVILLLFSGFGEGSKYINYKDMIKDRIPACGSKTPQRMCQISSQPLPSWL